MERCYHRHYHRKQSRKKIRAAIFLTLLWKEVRHLFHWKRTREATLVVGIYTEDGMEMTASGITQVTPDTETVTVDIAAEEMPQYFLVRAFLLDSDYSPLCLAFESSLYTEEVQDILKKTVNDFDQDKVLNLDDSADKERKEKIYQLSVKEAKMMLKFNLEPLTEANFKEDIYQEINSLENEIRTGKELCRSATGNTLRNGLSGQELKAAVCICCESGMITALRASL